MKIAMQGNPRINIVSTEFSYEFTNSMAISFTGNAIDYLTSVKMPIDLKEWIWHEEVVNGQRLCIVTDKIIIADTSGVPVFGKISC